VLDDIETLAESLYRDSKLEALCVLLYGVVERETRLVDGELRRTYAMALRQLLSIRTMLAVARLLAARLHDRRGARRARPARARLGRVHPAPAAPPMRQRNRRSICP
jgi:hypothetical protein